MASGKRKVLVEVLGYLEDYACLTAHLWLNEIKELIESDFGVEVEVRFTDVKLLKEYREAPIIRVDGNEVMRGLPSESGYYYEVICGFLKRHLEAGESSSVGLEGS